ncbi:ORF6N domain-containing protein [Pedobacter sp. PWIIR3]
MDEKLLGISDEVVLNKIYLIRGQKVMLDRDLAELYGVETKQLKRQVRRNLERFPGDFMFELTAEEHKIIRSQFGTLKQGEHVKYSPLVFTEQGLAMLSSVLNSTIAIQVNIQIIRIFTRLRQTLSDNTDIRLEIQELKQKVEKQYLKQDHQDKNMEVLFSYLDELMEKKAKPRRRIGYMPDDL